MQESISLASGYGNFTVPPAAAKAAIRLIEAGPLPAGDAAGLPELREALAQRYAPSVTASQVVVTPGAKSALFALFKTLLRPQDEVLLPLPNWFGFGELIERAGGVVRALPLSPESNFALTPEILEAALTPSTRILLLSNPNNPTGRVYSHQELAALLQVTQRFPGLYVVSDEIYDLITFGPQPVPSLLDFADPHERHVVVNGFSKSLALIGWGVGYLVAPAAIAAACAAWQYATSVAVPAPNQHAALAATHAAPAIAAGLLAQLQPTRALLLAGLAALPLVPPTQPEGTYYVFPDFRAYLNPKLPAAEAAAELVASFREAGVLVVDGTSCGAPGFMRISYAVPESSLREAVARIARVLEQRRS
ncbi:pyridoxal phosphate-dependent aminotransferase [Hymenobacter taeanensis]|uniref:Pyridoxal phosphate-dependent aminotransferase n=1 Tax=Hymenobacter taeanensis TaxID=2735321 RepID=A0A6M6BBQ1_9BACT|nr:MULTISPECIES: pyridoxal phosphate-dependent aminotransferase [Hymenobacter]QJX45429.1 pyridoxal phosphate-dependent aminotransferase [Hymenobacter taeanensis]UOQ81327.1 pyridoxal phosphate-dependent aminotransferase [Hymenobacter sp. 5414T-23]